MLSLLICFFLPESIFNLIKPLTLIRLLAVCNLHLNEISTDRYKKAAIRLLFQNVVAVGGLEPPRPKAPDFESGVYTNFTIPPNFS